MPPRKEIPEALLAQIVEEAEAGETSYEVLAERCGMCRDTFVRRMREMGIVPKRVDRLGRRLSWPKPKPAPPLRPDQMVSAALDAVKSDRAPDGTAALALRLRREIEHQLSAIERMRENTDDADYQRFLVIGRMLSGLVRTLHAAMRAEQAPPPQPQRDYDFARDFDELRRELAERLEAILAQPEEAFSGEPE